VSSSLIEQAITLDRMTPEQVLDVQFPETELGYDKQRVDSFVAAVAEELRQLLREIATANEKATKPELGIGREIGDLLQRAHDIAVRTKNDAEREATVVRQQAQSEAAKLKKQSDDLLRNARKEAQDLIEDARVRSQRASEAAAQLQRLTQARATVMQREAYQEAKLIRHQAETAAQKVIAAAKDQGADEAKQLEERIRRLREVESKLRQRIKVLAGEVRSLQRQENPAPRHDHAVLAPDS
jgi:DivIVA domain-containing protein